MEYFVSNDNPATGNRDQKRHSLEAF